MGASKKVFITGATGFIGSHMVDLLAANGYEIKCLVRASSNLQWIEDHALELIEASIFNSEELSEHIRDTDYVLHIAGAVKAKNKEAYFKGNVESTRSILEACLAHQANLKKIIVISSLAASAPSTPENPVNEETPSNPISTYGKSKVAQEALCRKYMDRLPITIIRPPGVYGPRDTEILLFFKTLSKGLMTKMGFKRKTVSLIYVKDLVNGIFQAMNSEEAAGQTYFLSSFKEYDWDEIGHTAAKVMNQRYFTLRLPHFLIHLVAAISELIARVQNKNSTLNREKAREIVQESWACSPEKAKKDFNFKEQFSLEEGFRETVEWYKQKKWL